MHYPEEEFFPIDLAYFRLNPAGGHYEYLIQTYEH
jgi:hypothetical protein